MTKIIQAKERKDAEIAASLHPLVKEWFFSRFKEFSATQRYGVMNVWERKNHDYNNEQRGNPVQVEHETNASEYEQSVLIQGCKKLGEERLYFCDFFGGNGRQFTDLVLPVKTHWFVEQ